jgi:hypothetical protein
MHMMTSTAAKSERPSAYFLYNDDFARMTDAQADVGIQSGETLQLQLLKTPACV